MEGSGSAPATPDARWEYGIEYRGGLHREGMTEAQAYNWVAEFIADGGRPGAFNVCRRRLGPWELARSEGRAPEFPSSVLVGETE